MCEGSASIVVDRDRVEGACDEREVLPVGLLTRPRSDRGRSCERVSAHTSLGAAEVSVQFQPFQGSKNSSC